MDIFDEVPEISVQDMYSEIDQDAHLCVSSGIDKTRVEVAHESGLLMCLVYVERFVLDVITSKSLAFKVAVFGRNERTVVNNLYLSKHYRFFPMMVVPYPGKKYIFSVLVEVFRLACREMSLNDMSFRASPTSYFGDKCEAELFNDLVSRIREIGTSARVKAQIKSREIGSQRNYHSARKCIDNLFEVYSRLVVIRIDLSYDKSCKSSHDLESVRRDFARLLANRRHNKLFNRALVGYIWCLEYGELKGYHYHVTLFFDSAVVYKDTFLAQEIGEYWKTVITRGKGNYYNCNAVKSKYKRLGIGLIHRSDLEKRSNLLFAVAYLAKKEQYLMLKLSSKIKTFSTSAPRKRKSNAGRPPTKGLI